MTTQAPSGFDDIPVDVRETLIDAYGLTSDGEGNVFFEADYMGGDINVDEGVVLITMTGGAITLGGALTPAEVDLIIDELVNSVTELEAALAQRADLETADTLLDGYATRDSFEEAIASEEVGLHSYLVLEGVWQYLDDTGQWGTLAEWMTERVDNALI